MANRLVTQVMSDVSDLACVLANMSLNKLNRIIEYKDVDEVTIKGSNNIGFELNSKWWILDTDTDISTASAMDTGAISNGKDYYVYACDNAGSLVFLISLASTYPAGYTAATSRKLGGFHTLCANVGTIAGHTLTGYLANEILPQSVWDLVHRARNANMDNSGMVYDPGTNLWVAIYLAADDGASGFKSENGATIWDSGTWYTCVDRATKVGARLLHYHEFMSIAAGSNQETNISGSADPGTTGGHSDTASRRMISDIGCEDCCGVMYQWGLDNQMKIDGLPDTGDPAWSWYNLPGAKGSIYKQGTYGIVMSILGGYWGDSTNCGSECVKVNSYPWNSYTSIGARFACERL